MSGYSSKDDTVFISTSKNAKTYGKEYTLSYGAKGNYDDRFRIRRLGYYSHKIAFRFRTLSDSRMSFISVDINNG